MHEPVWNGCDGSAGGPVFGAALAALAVEREVEHGSLAQALEIDVAAFQEILDGSRRIGICAMARLASALRAKAIEFLQRTAILSLDVYAGGLDPLYFLADGPIRYEARMYMREINPRHRVPEADMTKRNPTLKSLSEDDVLDALGKLEVEMTYLLRAAVQRTGGTL